MASPIEKQLELDKSRKKFFEDSKFDPKNQKYGLFSFPGTLAVSNRAYFQETKAKKNSDGTVKVGPRNFLASHVKRGKTPDAYFSYPEYVADKYTPLVEPFKSDKERADQMRKKHDNSWRPGGKVSESYIIYPHEASDVFKTIKRKQADGSVRLEPRNFYTSPPKKGNNTPGVTIGKYPEHIPDPYERKEKLMRGKSQKGNGVIHDEAFKGTDHGNGTFWKDIDVYGIDSKVLVSKPKRSSSQKGAHHDLPFRPPNPTKGEIGKYPEYMPNPMHVPKRKAPAEQEPWRASTQQRTCPTPSVSSNVKNLRSDFPMLKKFL